ncbi:MAG: biotin/lipoyl-binding protein [Parabacteroides merdae]
MTSLNLVEKSFGGVVSPDQFSDLAFKMSGPLISLKVDEGQKVRTGQVVAEIDPQDFKWEYEAKKASFSNCRSTAATCEEAVIQTGYFEAGI